MSQFEEARTVYNYLLSTPSKTIEAECARVDALNWYVSGNYTERRESGAWLDSFRTKRNQFNVANAVDPTD